MPYNVDWLIQRRVVISILEGVASSNDVIKTNQESCDYINEGIAPVHYVLDASELGHITPRLDGLKNVVSFARQPNIGEVVVIGENKSLNFLSRVVFLILGIRQYHASNREAALHYLQSVDPSLGNYI